MPLPVQVFDHTVGCRGIVYRHAGQVGNLQAGSTVGQQYAGNAQGFQLRGEIVQVGAEEHNAVRLALGTDTLGLHHFVGFLVNIVDKGYVAAGGDFALQLFQNIGKQHILGAFYDQGNAIVCLLLQVLGIGVGFVIVAVDHLQNPAAGFGADAGGVVQRPRYGADCVAGFPRNVFNRHGAKPSFG